MSLGLGLDKEAFCLGVLTLEAIDAAAAVDEELPEYELDRPVMLSMGHANPTVRLGMNWHAVEATGTWTRGATGGLRLCLPPKLDRDLYLHFEWRRFPNGSEDPDAVHVTCNGSRLGVAKITDEWSSASVRVPSEVLLTGRINAFDFTLESSRPRDFMASGGDARDLGLMVRMICLSRIEVASLIHESQVMKSDAKVARHGVAIARNVGRRLARLLPRRGDTSVVQRAR